MAKGEVASDFEKIIHAARNRKKNEALAARIFGTSSNRRASAPLKATTGGSLASRSGIQKRIASNVSGTRRNQNNNAGNIDGEWTHDLHAAHSAPSTPRGNSLASRITNPKFQSRRAAQVAMGLDNMRAVPTGPRQNGGANSAKRGAAGGHGAIPVAPKAMTGFNQGITIRGLAGPYVVLAQNFAPGTSAMTPVGGIISSCRIVKTKPITVAEIVFESKEGADNVIATFDSQTADGRVLKVFYKVGGAAPSASISNAHTGSSAASQREDAVVDGTLGFDDPMETDDGYRNCGGGTGWTRDVTRGNGGNGSNGLYSDSMVNHEDGPRRGRGYGRGGRGPGR